MRKGVRTLIGISIREFARRDGCNDKLVRRAIKEKKLAALEDGKLDPALVGSDWRKENRRSTRADNTADKGADKSAPVRTVKKDGRQGVVRDLGAGEEPIVVNLEDFIDKILKGDFPSLADAEKAKESALALKHLLDGRKRAGESVDASVAEAVLYEQARAARDQWLGFPSRIGPLLAADLNVEPERVVEALTAHVHQQLADIGEPEADFGGPDRQATTGVASGLDAAAKD